MEAEADTLNHRNEEAWLSACVSHAHTLTQLSYYHILLPCLAVYSLSSMSLARPKSAILHTRLSPTRMLAARRSRWM